MVSSGRASLCLEEGRGVRASSCSSSRAADRLERQSGSRSWCALEVVSLLTYGAIKLTAAWGDLQVYLQKKKEDAVSIATS